MNLPDNALLELAWQMRRDYPGEPERFREVLHSSLLPMIRCALDSGMGHPSLVRWVRRQAACEPGRTPDSVKAAPPMARVLCERIMDRLDPLPNRETVVETFGLPSRASA